MENKDSKNGQLNKFYAYFFCSLMLLLYMLVDVVRDYHWFFTLCLSIVAAIWAAYCLFILETTKQPQIAGNVLGAIYIVSGIFIFKDIETFDNAWLDWIVIIWMGFVALYLFIMANGGREQEIVKKDDKERIINKYKTIQILDKQLGKTVIEKKNIGGECFTYHHNDKIKYSGVYDKNNIGLCKEYDESGNLIAEFEFKFSASFHQDNPYKCGKYTSYYENGQIKEQGIYESDKKISHWIGYYENGQKEYEMNYNEKNLKLFYENTNLALDVSSEHIQLYYENGQKFIVYKYYEKKQKFDKNGKLICEMNLGVNKGVWHNAKNEEKTLIQIRSMEIPHESLIQKIKELISAPIIKTINKTDESVEEIQYDENGKIQTRSIDKMGITILLEEFENGILVFRQDENTEQHYENNILIHKITYPSEKTKQEQLFYPNGMLKENRLYLKDVKQEAKKEYERQEMEYNRAIEKAKIDYDIKKQEREKEAQFQYDKAMRDYERKLRDWDGRRYSEPKEPRKSDFYSRYSIENPIDRIRKPSLESIIKDMEHSAPYAKQGTWQFYDEKSKLIKEEVYDKNELVDMRHFNDK